MSSDDITARISDGATAASSPVALSFGQSHLEIAYSDGRAKEEWPYASLFTSAPVRRGDHDVLLHSPVHPDTTLFVHGEGFAVGLLARAPHLGRNAHNWRFARPALILSAILLIVAGLYWVIDPSPARTMAGWLPDGFRKTAGENLLRAFSNNRKQCAEADGDAALTSLVARVAGDDPELQQLEVAVINWGIVNAFALPGGKLVLTRGLIHDAVSPDEVAGVLAHEMGHGIQLHPETAMVRAIGISVAAKVIFAGSSESVGELGAFLLQLNYSREAEREADDEALRLLRDAQISPAPLGEFFDRLTKKAGGTDRAAQLKFLSTHPSNLERAQKIKAQPAYAWRPALTASEWDALRRICGADKGADETDEGSDDATNPDATAAGDPT